MRDGPGASRFKKEGGKGYPAGPQSDARVMPQGVPEESSAHLDDVTVEFANIGLQVLEGSIRNRALVGVSNHDARWRMEPASPSSLRAEATDRRCMASSCRIV